MEGEFTAAVLTMVAKSSSPEMASRLAHGEKEVLIPLSGLLAIHGSGAVCLTFLIGSQCAEFLRSCCMHGCTRILSYKGLPTQEYFSILVLSLQLTQVKGMPK